MGEPITLKKGKEQLIVYGRNEAARQVAKGWSLGEADKDLPLPPVPIDATDGAKELAEDNGIDLALVKGTGQDGRIIKADVQAYIERNNSAN